MIGIIQPNISTDYPHVLTIGPEFYESFQTWPNTKYTYGFNLAKNGTANRDSLLSSVPYACKALENGKLLHWELGNEPDLYKTSSQGIVRPATWNEQDYVDEWLNGTRAIRSTMAKTCPGLTTNAKYNYYAPSFAGTDNSLNPIVTWEDGLDTDKDIAVITSHNVRSASRIVRVEQLTYAVYWWSHSTRCHAAGHIDEPHIERRFGRSTAQ